MIEISVFSCVRCLELLFYLVPGWSSLLCLISWVSDPRPIRHYSRLCPRKNWREPSVLNLWNPGCLACDLYKKLLFSHHPGAKIRLDSGHWAMQEHSLGIIWNNNQFWKAVSLYFTHLYDKVTAKMSNV